jgi:hypothetical protein
MGKRFGFHYFLGRCSSVIDSIQNSASTLHWSISNIISDINVSSLSFSCCSFSHVLRSANVLAHSLTAWVHFCNCPSACYSHLLPSRSCSSSGFDRWFWPLDSSFFLMQYSLFIKKKKKNHGRNSL